MSFADAAAWLRANADLHATGSRDFGRGFMHAATALEAAAADIVECEVIAAPDQVVWTLTAQDAADYAGRELTEDECFQLAECIPNSSIPDALHTILGDALGIVPGDDDDRFAFCEHGRHRDDACNECSDDDERQCAKCEDTVSYLSSRGLCDGCEELAEQAVMWP